MTSDDTTVRESCVTRQLHICTFELDHVTDVIVSRMRRGNCRLEHKGKGITESKARGQSGSWRQSFICVLKGKKLILRADLFSQTRNPLPPFVSILREVCIRE